MPGGGSAQGGSAQILLVICSRRSMTTVTPSAVNACGEADRSGGGDFGSSPATANTITKLALDICDTYAYPAAVVGQAVAARIPMVVLPSRRSTGIVSFPGSTYKVCVASQYYLAKGPSCFNNRFHWKGTAVMKDSVLFVEMRSLTVKLAGVVQLTVDMFGHTFPGIQSLPRRMVKTLRV
ncbi:hypothetical protein K438DRAFT_1770324 [Mycena galopus ATCC 62051]|nr:hypothetical protein K438DRAFT_1770324 [Mycena galopus ATCC 62051]